MVRKRMNLSVREFLAELRLDYARQLLCQSDLPVKAVAEQCAYNYPGYFIREFRRKFGCTPAVFRKNIVSQQNNKNI